jgi:glucose/arabinose dehydrogenase
VNLIEEGENYGWPVATFSDEYWGPPVSDNKTLPGMVDAIVVWTPSPAPSGLEFYTGDVMPDWQGDLFSGGLASRDVRRIDLDDQGNVLGQAQIQVGRRVRDVRQGPDGYLYLITDETNGELIRIEPAS